MNCSFVGLTVKFELALDFMISSENFLKETSSLCLEHENRTCETN